jgi:hypothetical protein
LNPEIEELEDLIDLNTQTILTAIADQVDALGIGVLYAFDVNKH